MPEPTPVLPRVEDGDVPPADGLLGLARRIAALVSWASRQGVPW